MRFVRHLTAFAALLAFATGLPAQNQSTSKDPKKDQDEIGTRDVGKGVNFYSIEREIALGKKLADASQRQANVVQHAFVSEYVIRLCQNLVRNSDSKVPFTIKVIEGDQVNALSL